MRKVIIGIVVAIIILAIPFIWMYIDSNRILSTIDDFETKNYYLLENEFPMKFPESTKVESVSYLKGKDSVLYVKITLNEFDVIKFNQSIGCETEEEKNSDSNVERVVL